MRPRLLLALTTIALVASCAPVTTTTALNVAPAEALECAASTLTMLGYDVEENVAPDVIAGERDKHARNPFRDGNDADVITVSVKNGKLRVRGESVYGGPHFGTQTRRGAMEMPPERLDRTGTRGAPSRAVREDVAKIAGSCGGV